MRGIILAALLLCSGLGFAQPVFVTNRVPVTTLRLPTAPPVASYAFVNAFGTLPVTDPVALASPPGETNRLFVVEQTGRIIVITNLANPNRTVFLDLTDRVRFGGEEGLLGLAFHPGYASNRFFFVFYTTYTNQTAGAASRHDRLSRFESSPQNPNQGLANSEVVLINQPDQASNHNAGDLHFGPDGYLYVSVGDEGGANDQYGNSQRIDRDFFSGVLRLDVDKRPGSLAPNPHSAASTNYAIPPDNPFVGTTSFNGVPVNSAAVRTEFWAVGMRNPWRFSFDPATGWLYLGDVGQNAREEVNVVVAGGNYGWNYREGAIARPGAPAPPAGFSAREPVYDYARSPSGATNVGFSVTGGVVYRGTNIAALEGHYIFADYGSGNLWALEYDGTSRTAFAHLLTEPGITAFGIDPRNGDVLVANLNSDQIRRLVRNVSGPPLPPTLADTGLFADLVSLTPNPGVIPYAVNLPYWANGAEAQRWFGISNASSRITFRATNAWTFPNNSFWVQHFELERTNGEPASRERLETRVLVRNSAGVYGLSYRWGGSVSNATLVPDAGMDEPLVIHESGTTRTQVWHYAGRSECVSCHTFQGGLALGFNTPQLNRDFEYGQGRQNQVQVLSDAEYFQQPISNRHTLRRVVPLTENAASVEWRARSYLAVNCAHCHAPSAPGRGQFDTRFFTPLSATKMVEGELVNDGGSTNNRVLVPGDPAHSMLLQRMATPGPGHMPPLESTLIDSNAVALITQWIEDALAGYRSFSDWQRDYFGNTNSTPAQPGSDPDQDGTPNLLEYLVSTEPTNAASAWRIRIERETDTVRIVFPQTANRGFEVQWTTNLHQPAWRPLDVPANRPWLFPTNRTAVVPEALTHDSAQFYRVRVYEP